MSERFVELLDAVRSSLSEPAWGSLAAIGVALLRVMYDDKEPRMSRRLLEAALCGALAYSIASGLEHFGLSAGLSVFVGGAVGGMGADRVREIGYRYTKRKGGLDNDRTTPTV